VDAVGASVVIDVAELGASEDWRIPGPERVDNDRGDGHEGEQRGDSERRRLRRTARGDPGAPTDDPLRPRPSPPALA
jgi:hypothetical protein